MPGLSSVCIYKGNTSKLNPLENIILYFLEVKEALTLMFHMVGYSTQVDICGSANSLLTFCCTTESSDPFVELTLGQHHAKTKVKKQTLDPKWEKEVHLMPIKSWDLLNVLTLRVRNNYRMGRSVELGYVVFALRDLSHCAF